MPNYIRIGGLIRDLEDGFVDRLRAFTNHFDTRVDEYETLLTKNPIYVDRTKGIGILPLADAIALGASGPLIRGFRAAVGHSKERAVQRLRGVRFRHSRGNRL